MSRFPMMLRAHVLAWSAFAHPLLFELTPSAYCAWNGTLCNVFLFFSLPFLLLP